jgi:eukaryotic-like serine/threonine-protein kinase
MIPIGSVVDGYRVQRVIGAGGMGTVYAVSDPQLPRLDALKVLSAELSADGDFRARFVRESDIAAVLDHPNIVSVYDRGETTAGQLWISMQYVDGIDADAAVKAGAMTPARAVHVVAGIAEALDYAHARNVVHRDVKPANFLLSGPVGPDERVLLGDFGIARALDDAGVTATGAVVATMAYAAPEVIESQVVDGRADLYSLGCSLFRMLTGRTPFHRATGMAAVVMAHLHQPPPRVSELLPGLPPALDAVLGKAMAKDPAQRYQSGRELASAAAAALRDERTEVFYHDPTRPLPRPAPTFYRGPGGPPWPAPPVTQRRSRRGLLAAAAAVVVVIAGGVTAAVVATRSSDVPVASTPAPAVSSAAPSAAALVPDSGLSGLLLAPEQIGAVMGPGLVEQSPFTGLANDSSAVMSTKCLGAMLPIQRTAYADSGFTAAYGRTFGPPDPAAPETQQVTRQVIEGAVSFGSAELAQTFMSRQAVLWDQCANQSVTFWGKDSQPSRDWTLSTTSHTGGMLSVAATPQGKDGACQHAMTARNNVVIDVIACPATLADSQPAVTVLDQIAANIPN